MVVAGSQCPRAMLLALGFWVRYRGWENATEGRKEHAVRSERPAWLSERDAQDANSCSRIAVQGSITYVMCNTERVRGAPAGRAV